MDHAEGKPPLGDVDEALAGLVHQFADTLAFLRELVQNAIDAGTSEIAIGCTFEGDEVRGVATIEVTDSGCGMTREIIETKLTRLFASSKDGDRTKIGRFGIGFVSVFALDPDAVCVDTSREGERWRLLFGPDRTFDLRALTEPLEGTRVRVIKSMTRGEYESLRERVPTTVRKWCRHTDCEIRVDGIVVNEPIDLPDAPCRISVQDGLARIVVGHPLDARSFFGFYNAGLTLLEGDDRFLSAIAFKISSPHLEHTLTRDKVIEDAGYRRALDAMRTLVHGRLAERAVEMLAQFFASPGPDELLAYLCHAVLWHLRASSIGLHRARRTGLFRTPAGASLSLHACGARHRGGQILVARARTALTDALEREGRTVVLATAEPVVELLRAVARTDVAVVDVAHAWCMAMPTRGRVADRRGAALMRAVSELLASCGGKLSGVELGRFIPEGSPVTSLVAITQAGPYRATPIAGARTLGTWWLSRRRLLVINEEHPLVSTLAELAATRPSFAAYLLVKAFWLGARLDPRLDGKLARAAWDATP